MSDKENQSLEQQQPQEEDQINTESQASREKQQSEEHKKQATPSEAKSQTPGKGMDKLLNKVPNMAPDGPLGTEQKGPLSAIGDPLGQVLGKGLKPLGHVTGKIGNPHGEALLRVQRVAASEGVAEGEPKYLPDQDNGKPDRELPGGERIGGKEQTGENPLGL